MQLTPLVTTKIVAFIDVLGVKHMIDNFEKGDYNEFQFFKEAIGEAMGEFHGKFEKLYVFEENDMSDWRKKNITFTTFSDCICISIPVDNSELEFLKHLRIFFRCVAFFQTIMLRFGGYLIRGGISVGKFYADDNIIFSKALVNAHELESKKAVFPRILIDEILLKKINDEMVKTDKFLTSFPLLTKFEDGYTFLNFMNAELVDNPLPDKLNEIQKEFIEDLEKDWRNKTIMPPIIDELKAKINNGNLDDRAIAKYHWMLRFIYREINRTEYDIGF